MNVLTIAPFFVVAGLALFALRRRRSEENRARREEGFLASLPPRSTSADDTDQLALEALDHLCSASGSVPGVYVDMTDYFRRRTWNPADVHHVMGRLHALGFAHQVVSATHPISPYRYRATAAGVRRNGRNIAGKEAAMDISFQQETGSGSIITNVNSPGTRNWIQHSHVQHEEVSLERLAQALREDAAHAPQEVADSALSHADSLDTALAGGGNVTTEQAVGRVRRFLATAGAGFEATRQLLDLLGN
ncbi:hypothetical protein [Streptomyces sp. NRRL S-31]|uniref:hypothetical protein n=1 Tax=Streptomyces sp. NRRL S-31 TaxID=1463898 RepID=UPI0004CBE126|nr:hypothetical protein [Streptomyces sp. NRRL S-31]